MRSIWVSHFSLCETKRSFETFLQLYRKQCIMYIRIACCILGSDGNDTCAEGCMAKHGKHFYFSFEQIQESTANNSQIWWNKKVRVFPNELKLKVSAIDTATELNLWICITKTEWIPLLKRRSRDVQWTQEEVVCSVYVFNAIQHV